MRNRRARALRAVSSFAPARGLWGAAGPQAPHQSWQGRWLQARTGTMPEQGQRTPVLSAVMAPLPRIPLGASSLSAELLVLPRRIPVRQREGGGGPRKGLLWNRTWNLSPGVAAGTPAGRPGRSPCPQHPRGTRPTAGQRQQRARVKPEPFNCVLTGTGGGRGQGSRAAAVPEPEGSKEKGRRRRAGSEHSLLCEGTALLWGGTCTVTPV